MRKIDLTGKKFGRLYVLQEDGHLGRCVAWLVECDCGNQFRVAGDSLRSGNTMSCGCYQRDRARDANTVHGGASRGHKERLYAIWEGMKKRCYQPNCKSYKDYGARGITVCDEWKNDYSAFKSWAYANGYRWNLTIERNDNNKGYGPANCCWIPKSEQSKNRRPFTRRK